MKDELLHEGVRASIEDEDLMLLPEKAIYWDKEKILIIADLHIGKVTHFRLNHIPVPAQAAEKNFVQLEALLKKLNPKTVLFLGDLFHSSYNKEWEELCDLLERYREITFELVTGNHDILQEEHYHNAGIICFSKKRMGPFRFTHHPEESELGYNLCGHIHPGVRINGIARQSMKLPCFYFGKKQGILPAFGVFTGTAAIKVFSEDSVYAVLDNRILKLET